MHEEFLKCLADRYPAIRLQYPGEGRRKWHLRVLQEFWQGVLNKEACTPAVGPSKLVNDDFTQDDDPLDGLLDGRELGLLLRTDYSNEEAWQAFCTKLQGAEKELAEAVKPDPDTKENEVGLSMQHQAQDDSDSDTESSAGVPFPIIKILDPSPQDRTIFQNISNLSALRLLNDVNIRASPTPPAGERRIHPPNRLIDQGTWQEIYSGMNVWIYDAQSNTDQCVRLVSQEGDIYGTATGDSWRVQGSHICELQFNMTFLGMTINFGGLDRWDYTQRRRNLEEANQII